MSSAREKLGNRFVICAEKFDKKESKMVPIATFRRTFKDTVETIHSLKEVGYHIDSVEEKQLVSIWLQAEIAYKDKYGDDI